jgi:hypothetical protein
VKRAIGVLAAASIVAAGAGSSEVGARPQACSFVRLPRAAVAGQTTWWGHIKSLHRKGGHFELRFDPAWWLGGLTADRAAAEDKREVANDYYIVDESHRLLTYYVPAGARATVITNGATRGLCSTPVTVAELAQIVAGRNPMRRQLYDRARGLGFWLLVDFHYPDPVRSLDQQYQP